MAAVLVLCDSVDWLRLSLFLCIPGIRKRANVHFLSKFLPERYRRDSDLYLEIDKFNKKHSQSFAVHFATLRAILLWLRDFEHFEVTIFIIFGCDVFLRNGQYLKSEHLCPHRAVLLPQRSLRRGYCRHRHRLPGRRNCGVPPLGLSA